METSELLKKVRRIEIKARGLSNIFAGQYHSAFKGPWYGVQRGEGISVRR